MYKTIRIFSLLAVVFALSLSSCGTSKKVAEKAPAPAPSVEKAVPGYVGNWAYDLETPQGNFPGVMVIEQEGDVVKGKLTSDQGSVDIDDLKIENDMLTGTFFIFQSL